MLENVEFYSLCREIWRLSNIKQMKALLMGLEELTVDVKLYVGDYHQKQEFTIQSVFFAREVSKGF